MDRHVRVREVKPRPGAPDRNALSGPVPVGEIAPEDRPVRETEGEPDRLVVVLSEPAARFGDDALRLLPEEIDRQVDRVSSEVVQDPAFFRREAMPRHGGPGQNVGVQPKLDLHRTPERARAHQLADPLVGRPEASIEVQHQPGGRSHPFDLGQLSGEDDRLL